MAAGEKPFVIKVGGTLIPRYAGEVCRVVQASRQHFEMTVVPGGGEFVDLLKKYRIAYEVAAESAYAIALLAMQQNAFLLKDLGGLALVWSLEEARAKMELGLVPVFAPSNRDLDPALFGDPDMYELSSDAVAAYCALALRGGLIKVTDVDGIYDRDPHVYSDAVLLNETSAEELVDRTCFDTGTPRIISKYEIPAWVVNGKVPDRIRQVMAGELFVGTTLRL